YVAAMELKPDNHAIVHHIVVYIDPTGKSSEMEGKDGQPGYTVLGQIGIGIPNAIWGDVWVPGNANRVLPPGVAVKLPAGSRLVMQVHYHKNGKPEVDRSKIALYFAKSKVEKRMNTWPVGSYAIDLKPGLDNQELRASLTVPMNCHLWSVFPHMHM